MFMTNTFLEILGLSLNYRTDIIDIILISRFGDIHFHQITYAFCNFCMSFRHELKIMANKIFFFYISHHTCLIQNILILPWMSSPNQVMFIWNEALTRCNLNSHIILHRIFMLHLGFWFLSHFTEHVHSFSRTAFLTSTQNFWTNEPKRILFESNTKALWSSKHLAKSVQVCEGRISREWLWEWLRGKDQTQVAPLWFWHWGDHVPTCTTQPVHTETSLVSLQSGSALRHFLRCQHVQFQSKRSGLA